MGTKYQVFVSSTYADLINERNEAIKAILESNCIPIGIEMFPTSNNGSWETIKKVIDDSDYYLLIVAGRYGSLGKGDEGETIGYTEMEFDYAVKINKPIIALIHNSIDHLSASRVETEKSQIDRLERFKKKICSTRMVRFWNNIDDLRTSILISLNYIAKNSIAEDWVIPQYRYGEGFVEYPDMLLPQKDIIVPSNDIVSNLIIVNKSLLSKIKGNENQIDKLTSREFEELVCEILEKNGLTVKMKKSPNRSQ